MNDKINNPRSGISLICVGVGIYLLVTEFVRLINFFAAELGQLASIIYLLGCFVCSVLITLGIIFLMKVVPRVGIVAATILGIVGFPALGIALIYCAYLIPFTEHWRFEVSDWLLLTLICFIGIFLVGYGVKVLRRANGSNN